MECNVGKICEVKEKSIVVLIERQSACSACHARGACLSSDKNEQRVEVTDYPPGIQLGDEVRIMASSGGSPLKAVLFAFVIPILILLVEAVLLSLMGISEPLLLLVLLCSLLLYAVVLRMLHGYFDKTFRLRADRL